MFLIKTAIIGAGAMGSVFGGIFQEGGDEVFLIDIWEEHVREIEKRGLLISGLGGERQISMKAFTSPAGLGEMDLILLLIKSYHTSQALESIQCLLGPGTTILTLQNGLGHIEKIQEAFPDTQLMVGATSYGAFMVGPGHVCHTAIGDTYIGHLEDPEHPVLKDLVERWQGWGIKVSISYSILGFLWSKLLVNAGINGLTAATSLLNGALLKYPESKAYLTKLVEEGWEVARALKIDLLYDDPIKQTLQVAANTSNNRSSMLQDLFQKKKTEIDAINGTIVREGESLGIETPYNRALIYLIKTLESSYDSRVL